MTHHMTHVREEVVLREEVDSLSSSMRLCMCRGTGCDDTRTGDEGRRDRNSEWSDV